MLILELLQPQVLVPWLLGMVFGVFVGATPGLTATMAVALIVPIKTALYFLLMTRQRMRTRSATLASLGLSNFSEFGLIVGAIGVSHTWLDPTWLSILALSLAFSFLLAAPLNAMSKKMYRRWRHPLHRFETRQRLPGDEVIRAGKAQVIVFGMGRVGTGAYDYLRAQWGDVVLGIDVNEDAVERHRERRLPSYQSRFTAGQHSVNRLPCTCHQRHLHHGVGDDGRRVARHARLRRHRERDHDTPAVARPDRRG